ncbi:MAG: M23 family metallopeptidase [Deltaproteobacteria bacterium]|nr:M23 family metallopeptidase [Deltaproteobacteria bacterium]MBW2595804.1 M23 family metallopeptidase [Deltaproteobacteria bacterium]MBW2650461.1 M23 family metallopeptidase [Deltaproteobacteria bacterium]
MKTSARFLIICLMLMTLCPGYLNAATMISPTDEGEVTISSEYRRLSQGEIVKISLQSPVPASAVLSFDGKEYTFTSDDTKRKHFTLIVFGLDMEPGTYDVVVRLKPSRGTPKDIPFKLAISQGAFPSKRIRVARRFTSFTSADIRRIKNEKELLGRIYSIFTPNWLGGGRFILPLKGKITGTFGEKRVFNDNFVSRHRGIDIRSPRGAPVMASNSGEVALVRDLYFSGNTVIVNHGLGLFSIYCHMSKVIVRKGDFIDKGESIGYTGSTGRSTGPHLHWGLRLVDDYADPLSMIYLSFN